MKTLLPLLLFPISIFAQNWTLVTPGETYHYRLPNADFITHTIKADSVRQIGNNTIYHLNRVVFWDALPQGSQLIFGNQGQFLFQTITDDGAGKLFLDAESGFPPASLTMFPQAGHGFSWLADANNNISATISAVTLGSVLGLPDSLKTIQFSNGSQWVLSKHHGVVSCPNLAGNATLHLSGLESAQLGDRLYRFEDFFDLQPGTILEYVEDYTGLFGWDASRSKILILNKSFMADTARYQVQRKWKQTQFSLQTGTSTTFGVDTVWLEYKNSDFPFLSAYNNQFLPLHPCNCKGTFALVSKNGVDIGEPQFPFSSFYCGVLEEDSFFPGLNILACSDEGYFEQFRPGLGQTEYYRSIIDNSEYKRLAGAIVQGDTVWGSITPDWDFTATSSPVREIGSLDLSPNPAFDYVNLHFPGLKEGEALLQIFNTENMLCHSQERFGLNGRTIVDLSGFPSGIYLILLNTGARIWREWLVKL